jgi:hypothetical protein
MAYAVKYLFKFQSSNGIVREIRVLQDGYSGDVIQRPLGRAPVIKKEQNEGVHGTSLTFYAECHVDQEYIEFYTSDPKEYRVDVYAGSTLLWQGYITPELYSEPDIAPPYDVQVVATDGVGELKLYDFTPQGTVTLRSLLAYLLGHTGLSTDVNLISSLKPGSHGAGALLDMQICIDYFAGKDCYEALTYILDTLHATITRWGGAWLLVRETNVTFTGDKVRYFNTSGNSALLAGSVQTLGAMRSAPAWPVGQLSTVIDPAKNKVVVQAPWHPVSGLVNSGMTSDTGWTKAGGAVYDATNVGYHFPAASLSALPRISQEIVMSGLRMPFRMSGRFTGVSADLSLSTLFTAGIGFYVTYTTSGATYHLERSDEGIVWKQGAMPGLLGFDDTLSTFLQNFDEDRTAGREIGFTVPPFVQGSAFPAGTLKIYIIGNCARIYAATLDVEVSKGYQDILRIDNGARGEGDEVEIAIGRQTADVVYYQSFLQGLLLDSGSLITGFTDANFTTAMDYLALISRDYALSAALPRALAKGTVYLESSIGMPPLVFAKGGLNYWLETWSWDLYEDELEISARTLPSASLTVQSETILESNGSMVSSGASGGSSGGSIDGGAGVNYFQINSDRAELVELKSQYSYLGPRKGLIFDANSSEDPVADLEVVTKTIDGTPRRVLHSRLPFYTDGFLSGGGLSTTGGGGGGIDPAAMWALLAAPTSEQINSSHITFPVTSVVNQTGNITASQIATALGLGDLAYKDSLVASDIPDLSATYQPKDADLTAIAGLTGTSGLLKKTAANTWTLDTSAYITGINSTMVTTALGYTPVPNTRKVNNKALSSDITLSLDDVADGSTRKLANYLPLTGGSDHPMTGAIYVPTNTSALTVVGSSSSILFGVADTSSYFGQTAGTTYLRSGNTNLQHRKNGTDYAIYDSGNLDSTTVQTIIGANVYHPYGGGVINTTTGHLFVNDYQTSNPRVAKAYLVVNKGSDYFGMGASASSISTMAFGTATNEGGTWKQETMYLTDGGLVGIGVIPSYTFDVSGTARVTTLKIGNGAPTLTWDATNSAWHLSGSLYVDGFLSGGGLSTTGGGGGIDPTAMWNLLAAPTSEQINSSHITFPVTSVVGQTGNVTATQIANAIGLSDYLPLSAGSSYPLTGTLTIKTSSWGEQLDIFRSTSVGDSFIKFRNSGDGVLGYLGIRGSGSNKVPAYAADVTNVYTLYHSGNLTKSVLTGLLDASGGYYLPLAGGTITGNGATPLTIKSSNDTESWIQFLTRTNTSSYIGYTDARGLTYYENGSKTVYHSGNFVAGANYQAPISAGTGITINNNNQVSVTASTYHPYGGNQGLNLSASYIYADNYGNTGNTSVASIIINKGGDYWGLGCNSALTSFAMGTTTNTTGTWKNIAVVITNAGAMTLGGSLSATTLTSTAATGTAPLSVTSTTVVSNLNADLLDGQHGSYFATASSVTTLEGYFVNGVAKIARKLSTVYTDGVTWYDAQYPVIAQWDDNSHVRMKCTNSAGTLTYDVRVNAADKFVTSRSIWGQSFDGTGNVTGALSAVTDIDSLLYFDTNNSRIGIGTSPSYNLHVVGSMYSSTTITAGTALSAPYASLGRDGANGIYLQSRKSDGTGYYDGANIVINGTGSYWRGIGNGATNDTLVIGPVSANTGTWAPSGSITLLVRGVVHSTVGIYSNGYVSGGGLSTSSDQRLKANIKDFGYSKDLLMSVRPREWDWNELTPMKGHAAGFVAQEIEPILPYAVTERTYKQLYYDMFHALEISGLQDHERRIAALENENRMLKEEIKRLRS